jgi:hypothetical protein
MTLETSELNQDAVLWSFTGIDDYSRPRVGSATALRVRWEHKLQENLNPQTQAQAVVAHVVVDRDIAVGSILWEGAIADVGVSPTPLYQVSSLKKIPDVNYTGTLPSA